MTLIFLLHRIIEQTKVCSPEVQDRELDVHPPCCPKGLEHHFTVTEAKAALELHILQPLLVGENQIHTVPPLLGSSITWRRKLSPMHSRNLLDCSCIGVCFKVAEDPP